jgi:hypothetical protein
MAVQSCQASAFGSCLFSQDNFDIMKLIYVGAAPTVTKYFATAQKVLKVRAAVGALTSLDAGKVYLFRRREYASLA